MFLDHILQTGRRSLRLPQRLGRFFEVSLVPVSLQTHNGLSDLGQQALGLLSDMIPKPIRKSTDHVIGRQGIGPVLL